MTIDELLAIAAANGIKVYDFRFREIVGISIPDGDGFSIGIDRTKCCSDAEYKVILGHELGHCIERAFYRHDDSDERKAAAERTADAWAAAHIVPFDELRRVISDGCNQIADLAVMFDVTDEFLQRALDIYQIDGLTA